MALRLIEGFDYLPTGTTNTNRLLEAGQYYLYTNLLGEATNNISTTTAFNFGNSLLLNAFFSASAIAHRSFYPVGEMSEGYIGMRMRVAANHTGYTGATFFDAINGLIHITVRPRVNGVIEVWRGEPRTGTLLISSPPGSFYYQEWFYMEVHCKVHATDGEVKVRINTVTVIDLVSADTQNGTRDKFDMVGWANAFGNNSVSWQEDIYIDDVYFCDTTGLINNNFLGNVRVKTMVTTGDGANIDLLIGGTAPAATNWESVQNTLLDSTKFVYSPTVGDYDVYHMNPVVNAPYVHAIQVRSAMRQDDATQRVGHNVLRTGFGTETEGDDHYLNQSFSFYRDIFEINPDSGVQFTGPEANLIEAGPKVYA